MNNELLYWILLAFNLLIGIGFFVLAVVYYFTEARADRLQNIKRAILLITVATVAGIIVAILTRYAVQFYESDFMDMNSEENFIGTMVSIVFNFFIYIFYIQCGQHFSRQRELPGSLYLKGESLRSRIDWKLILIPMPFLLAWTGLVFGLFPTEPTELAYAVTPANNDFSAVLYNIMTASVMAPIQEEILYRHFAMGILYRWFGRGRVAVVFNIIITGTVFAAAHVGVVTNDWVKVLQILPLGILLGLIYHKRGLENSILAHSAFNTFTVLITYVLGFLFPQ
ncbi:MAG TPA: CPBP family intramembrane metalloprotease [Candidatus Atribacteria bacterium]|nr:CPBP family intramembrane metalloprotease [Candidatus Atribacteria bacterium]HPT78344.1 CPBP family intramembrane metalloprotease [Candidatus Atribacteria bacterium]